MNKIDKLAKTLKASQVETNKTSPYDTTAEVISIENGMAWVKIPGGVERTPATMVVNAKAGDLVRIRVTGGKAYVTGNATAPPTDDTTALKAEDQAIRATQAADNAASAADVAQKSANSAIRDAAKANTAANNAIEDAARAYTAAEVAEALAESAQISADDAANAASNAQTSANDAAEAADKALQKADEAIASADTAQEMAEEAKESADEAKASARSAYSSANDALIQLGTVEDVIGTLEWIQEHGEDSIADYIQSHLALTDQGLYVLSDSSGYRLLLSADGAVITDPDGHIVSTFGESITFDSDRPQTIGGENAYLMYYDTDSDNKADSILISGNVTFGNMSLSDVLNNINNTNDFKDLYAGYITINANDTESPYSEEHPGPSIKLGKTDEPFAVRITNARLSFLVDTSELAYADSNVFAVDTGKYREMRMRSKNTTSPGEHTWFARDNGHLSLKLLEES